MLNIVVLISGTGSNLRALLEASADAEYPARVVAVGADRDDERYLRLTWQEVGGPRVRSEHDARFGTSTLERIVPNSVGGEAELHYRADGLQYSLSIPDSQFELNSPE